MKLKSKCITFLRMSETSSKLTHWSSKCIIEPGIPWKFFSTFHPPLLARLHIWNYKHWFINTNLYKINNTVHLSLSLRKLLHIFSRILLLVTFWKHLLTIGLNWAEKSHNTFPEKNELEAVLSLTTRSCTFSPF